MATDFEKPASLVVAGPDRTWVVPCRPGMVLGRSADADLTLPDEQYRVSRRHARLTLDDQSHWTIADDQSVNGVLVNGRSIDQARLRHGDLIEIGHYRLRFTCEDDQAIHADDPGTLSSSIVNTFVEPLQSVRRGSADGPQSLDRRQLQIMDEMLGELSGLTSVAEVAAASCRLLCQHLEAARAMLLSLSGNADEPRTEIVEEHEHAQWQTDEGSETGVSATLIEHIRRERLPILGELSGMTPGALELSLAHGGAEGAVAAAIAETTPDRDLVVYLVFNHPPASERLLELLGVLARQVGMAMRSARVHELSRRQAVMDHELAMARQIQHYLIESERSLQLGALHADIAYEPCSAVGGDYADTWPIDDTHLACVIADVTGHGLASAMVMSNVQAIVRSSLRSPGDLAETAATLNRSLLAHTPSHIFVTGLILVIDTQTHAVQVVNAGHPPPLRLTPDGTIQSVPVESGLPFGIDDFDYPIHADHIPPDEAWCLMTDGLLESMDEQGNQIGFDALTQWLKDRQKNNGTVATKDLLAFGSEWRGGEPCSDDQTLVILNHRGDRI